VRQVKLMQISWTIQPGQRLTTRPEQNFVRKEVTNYVRPKGWRIISQTQVKVSSPEMNIVAAGPRVSFSGSQQRDKRFGERVATGRGRSPWRVIQRFTSELGRTVSLPKEASNKLRKGKAEVRRRGSRTNS